MSYVPFESFDESHAVNIMNINAEYMSESHCQRFWLRLQTCLRESQEIDVLYDCRSRMIDFRECVSRYKQTTWAMRETMATLRNEKKFRDWLQRYDEKMGHPPLLEAVATVRRKLDEEGGVDVLNPTVFKDPDMYLPRKQYAAPALTPTAIPATTTTTSVSTNTTATTTAPS